MLAVRCDSWKWSVRVTMEGMQDMYEGGASACCGRCEVFCVAVSVRLCDCKCSCVAV